MVECSMSVKLLTEDKLEFLSLKGGCTGLSESTLVKMLHCWKSHATAHMYVFVAGFRSYITIIKKIKWFTGLDKEKNSA